MGEYDDLQSRRYEDRVTDELRSAIARRIDAILTSEESE